MTTPETTAELVEDVEHSIEDAMGRLETERRPKPSAPRVRLWPGKRSTGGSRSPRSS